MYLQPCWACQLLELGTKTGRVNAQPLGALNTGIQNRQLNEEKQPWFLGTVVSAKDYGRFWLLLGKISEELSGNTLRESDQVEIEQDEFGLS